ncbi:MAG: hypothetical protein ACK5N4_07160 [Parabacteroides gordonii]|uniref:hypothetical protein n=1 Tax=Parabacteroides gordonii TaxID=574930 RepID=UPI003A8A0965
MKLQNLIYATMVACAFSACSNDDDPNIPDPALEMDATLTVGFSAIGANNAPSTFSTPETRSNAEGSEVDKVGIAVFNAGAMSPAMASGALINYKEQSVTGSTIDSTACIDVKSGPVTILVVVNPPAGAFNGINTLENFKTAVTNNVELESAKPIMSSSTISVDVKKGRNVIASTTDISKFKDVSNPITEGGNIKVFRNIANIQLKSIKLNPREDFKTNAKLSIKKAYIMHYRDGVQFFGEATPWCKVVNNNASIVSNKEGGNVSDKYTHIFSLDVTEASPANDIAKLNGSFFVYDNSSEVPLSSINATALVIQGDYSYTTGNGEARTVENAYWTVYLNNTKAQAGTTNPDYSDATVHCGVLRNVQYIVNATITGPGSIDPETPSEAASLTSNIEVVEWGTVELNENID